MNRVPFFLITMFLLPAPPVMADRTFDCTADEYDAAPRTIFLEESTISVIVEGGDKLTFTRLPGNDSSWIVGAAEHPESDTRWEVLLNPKTGEHKLQILSMISDEEPFGVSGPCIERIADTDAQKNIVLICIADEYCSDYFGCGPPPSSWPWVTTRIVIDPNREKIFLGDSEVDWSYFSSTQVKFRIGQTNWTINRANNSFSRVVKGLDAPVYEMTFSGQCRLGDTLW
jgi:hypothetical protein